MKPGLLAGRESKRIALIARPCPAIERCWRTWLRLLPLSFALLAGCGGGTGADFNSLSPVASTAGSYTGRVGAAVTFSAAGSSDPQGQTLSYAWNFGDNTVGAGEVTTHIYAAAGSYTVTLTVTDSSNLSSTTRSTATIAAATGPSVATGVVYGGQQPVAGATVQLWQVGTTGYGTGAAPLGSVATTGNDGTFSLTGNYSCANAANGANTLVYLTATGGNPGLSAGTNNSALFLMSALGPCGNLTPTTFVSLNEVTTVASVYALAQFMDPTGTIGSFGSSNQGLINAFATVNNLVNIATGSALATTPNGNGVVPQAEINTLANILAPCVNSAGPTSGACTSLFSAVMPSGGAAPTTTVGAALNIAQNPGHNASALLLLPTATAPFQPTVTAVNNWTVAIGYNSGGTSPKALALDAAGNVWVANYGTGGSASSLSMITPLGVPATNSPFSGATYVNGATSLAIDTGNNVWLANHDNSSAMELGSTVTGSHYSIATVNGPFNGIGLNSPSGVAVDPSNNIWFTSSGNNSVTEIPSTGCSSLQCVTSFTGGGLNAPGAIALDSSGVAWVANASGGTITKISPNATVAAYTGGGFTTPAALAIDGSSNVWVTDSTLPLVSKLNGLGTAVSPNGGYTGGGVSGSSAAAIDGSGNLWTADAVGNSLSELKPSGAVVTPSTGYQGGSLSAPVSLAIDASGNIWVANGAPATSGSLPITVTEFVGAASPAFMPLAQAVKVAELGQQPGTAPIPKAPLAIATGPYSGTSGVSVGFNGTGSVDPKEESLSYTWNFGDGSGGTGAAPAHSYFSAGTYPVTLTVTNADGLQSSSSTSAVIGAPAAPNPVASAGGPYTGTAYTSVVFDGTSSYDPANLSAGALALTYAWSFGDGTQGGGNAPLHTYSAPGTYQVSVTVQSAAGTTAIATTTATIAAGTVPTGAPTANPGGPYSGAANTAVTFNGSGSSDPNSLSLSYGWSFGDGSGDTTPNPTHTYAQGGSYSVVLTVSNGAASATASTVATIASPAAPPALVANAGGPYTVAVNQPLALNGSQTTDPSGLQLAYAWDFGDGSSSRAAGSTTTHIYTRPGTYTINLNVNDGVSENGNATAQVTVTGPAAEVITATAGGPYQNVTSHSIVFDASASSDTLGNALTYAWSFGDGTTGGGATPTHAYATVGSYTATVTVSSSTASATATANVAISTAISVMVTSPTANALFASNTVTVTGTTSEPNLTVAVNGTPATVSGSTFTAAGVALREGVNLITATATDGKGGVGSGVVSVILDVTPPAVSITSPASGSTVTTSSTVVAGLVNDIVTGTIGSNDVTVTVNGLPAQVSNRSYLLPSLQLAPGTNTITVVATDKVGNHSQTTSTVQLLPASGQLSLVKLSGDSQSGVVGTVLPQTLVVQLVAANGTPVPGRPITFTVSRSDGMVEVMPTIVQSLTVTTDGTGKASVLSKLGSRSGLGINQVSATTPGAAGAAIFTETSTVGTPTQIHLVNGNHQRGLLGEPLAQAFQVIVEDAYSNPVPGVTVNYTMAGATDGSLDNPSPTTDSNGKAIANLTLGQQEGINNYAVSADFAGDAGGPTTFIASAYAPGPVANTSVSGIVLDNSNSPVQNATVTIQGTNLSTVTNVSGNFTISGAPIGTVTLTVDGSTAVSTETLPFLSFVLQDLPGQNNTLTKPIYLPAIDVNNAQTVGGNDPVTLTMAGVPGVAFTVAPNSVTFPDGSTVGKLSLSQVKSDSVPMEPSNGTAPNLVWTLQPAGTRFSVPVQVTVPNSQGLPPGYVSEMYQYDHDLEQFVSAGTGHVSADGSVIVSDPGFGITKAGWGHPGTPPVPDDCLESCQSNTVCLTPHLDTSDCECFDTANPGVACGNTKLPIDQCRYPGICTNAGQCTKNYKTDGTPCDDQLFCTTPDECQNGLCKGTPIPDNLDPNNDGADTIKIEKAFDSVMTPLEGFATKYKLPPFEVIPKFNVEFTDKVVCCETQKKLNVPVESNAYQGGVTVQTGQLPLPCCAVYIPGLGTQGIYGQLSVSLLGQITHIKDQCANTDCWTGGIVLEFQVQAGFAGNTGIVNVDANVSGGIHGDFTVGCHAIVTNLTSLDFKATGSIIVAATGASVSVNKIFIPAQPIYQDNIPF